MVDIVLLITPLALDIISNKENDIDPFLEEEGSRLREARNTARSRKVPEFSNGEVLPTCVAVSCISSLRRCHFARSLFAEPPEKADFDKHGEEVACIFRAMKGYLEDTRVLTRPDCPVASFLLACVTDPDIVRMKAIRSLLRTVVYLVDATLSKSSHRFLSFECLSYVGLRKID